jgi:F0F1-type ATP synthase membrane subunit b/b'
MKRGKNGKPVPLSKVMLKGEQVKAADDFSKLISSVIRGEKPSEATLAKIERLFPEYGKKFRQLATVTEADIKIDQLIRTATSNLDEISKVLARTTKELEELKMQKPGIIEKARAEGFEAGRAAAVATSPAEVIPEIKPETKPKIKLEEAKSLAWMKEDELHAAFKGMSQEDLHTWHDKLNAVREEYGRITEEAKANIDVINAMLAEDPVYNYRVPMGV